MAGRVVARVHRRRGLEWPTVALAAAIYAGWLTLTFWHRSLPIWLWLPALVWLVAWHSSLQHEVIHGHPTRWRRVNDAIGYPPLSLWVPYAAYRSSHLSHHRDERLTDPLDDPESFYWMHEHWNRLGAVGKALVRAQSCLAGRLLIGPAWNAIRFWRAEWATVRTDADRRRIWLLHLPGVVAVGLWVVVLCRIESMLYLFGVVYPATALLMLRSFPEHRAASGVAERTAIVEHAPVLGLLFLFNNLHAAHHDRPGLPWYRLPRYYRAERERLLRRNAGLVYRGYADVARRFLFRPHDRPLHPLGRAPVRA
jgi:fatty acid desaturase